MTPQRKKEMTQLIRTTLSVMGLPPMGKSLSLLRKRLELASLFGQMSVQDMIPMSGHTDALTWLETADEATIDSLWIDRN